MEYAYIYDGYSGNLPSGSASQTYSFPEDRERSYQAQLDKAAIGIIVLAPIYIEPVYNWELQEYTGERNVTYDEIQLELVCMKAGGDGDGLGDSEDNDDDDSQNASDSDENPRDNSAGRASVFILPVVIGALVALLY
jgi:hypothetical protein